MAVTTSLKRAFLDDAYEKATSGNTTLRAILRASEKAATALLQNGSLSAVTQNGRTTEFSIPSGYTVTTQEIVEAFRELIDLCDRTKEFLTWCNKYGLDPDFIARAGSPSGDLTPVANPVAVTDAHVYEWLMGSAAVANSTRAWPARLIAVREVRSDYTLARAGVGGWIA